MVFLTKVVSFVDFHVCGLTICIKPTEFIILIGQPVTAVKTKVIVVLNNRIPTVNFLKPLDMFGLHLVHPVINHHHYVLCTYPTVCKERSGANTWLSCCKDATSMWIRLVTPHDAWETWEVDNCRRRYRYVQVGFQPATLTTPCRQSFSHTVP